MVALQQDLAQLVPDGRLIIATESGHNIHQDQPELVTDAIRQVVAAVFLPVGIDFRHHRRDVGGGTARADPAVAAQRGAFQGRLRMAPDQERHRLGRHRAHLHRLELEELALEAEIFAGRQPANDVDHFVHAPAAALPRHAATTHDHCRS